MNALYRFGAGLMVCGMMLGIASTSHAALIFSNRLQANFDFEVVDGPFSTLVPTGTVIPFSAVGTLTFTLDDTGPDPTQMAFQNVTGSLTGTGPGAFMPFTMNPELEFVGGQLMNIVRNGSNEIIGGDVVNLQMRWEMLGTPAILGGATPVRLYTADPLPFNGSITGAPFSLGDMISGAPDFNVYLDAGLGNPGQVGGDPLAVIGRNRFLTAVPEPSSVAVLSLASLGLLRFRRRRSDVRTVVS